MNALLDWYRYSNARAHGICTGALDAYRAGNLEVGELAADRFDVAEARADALFDALFKPTTERACTEVAS